jgi:phospholipid transport system substrate-binding protein
VLAERPSDRLAQPLRSVDDEQTADLRVEAPLLAASVGLAWAKMPDTEKSQLEAAFRRYIIFSYVSNFDSYNGQRFVILPSTRQLPTGDAVVQTQMNRVNASPVRIDYVMHPGPAGWQVVDVLTDGTISRVAVQRSDFRSLLMSGGVPALTAELSRKTANLTGNIGKAPDGAPGSRG